MLPAVSVLFVSHRVGVLSGSLSGVIWDWTSPGGRTHGSRPYKNSDLSRCCEFARVLSHLLLEVPTPNCFRVVRGRKDPNRSQTQEGNNASGNLFVTVFLRMMSGYASVESRSRNAADCSSAWGRWYLIEFACRWVALVLLFPILNGGSR